MAKQRHSEAILYKIVTNRTCSGAYLVHRNVASRFKRMEDWEALLDPEDPDLATTRGNRITHLIDDDEAIRSLWQAIDEADERVWMSMYTLGNSDIGLKTVKRLAAAARRGCDVNLVYDQIGSLTLSEKHVAPLVHASGGKVAIFNRFWPPWKKQGCIRIRNHRKITVIDDWCAFCGGQNLSEAFAGDDLGSWRFTDTMARVEGPAVHDLANLIRKTWFEATGQSLPSTPRPSPLPDGVIASIADTDPRRKDTRLTEVLGAAIRQARKYCFFSTPYFVPPEWLLDSLLEAARRGAEVCILTAGKTDMPVARTAGRYYYDNLIRRGIRIFEMNVRIVHSKTVTVDGIFCSVGSFNMDTWTSHHVLDANVLAVDPSLAASLENEFHHHIEHATEYSTGTLRKNVLAQIGRRAAVSLLKHL